MGLGGQRWSTSMRNALFAVKEMFVRVGCHVQLLSFIPVVFVRSSAVLVQNHIMC